MKKRVLSMVLALAMVLSMLTTGVYAAGEDTISVGETVTVTISKSGDYADLYFTPEESGTYRFYSTSDEDTYGYLYLLNGEDYQCLAESDDGDPGCDCLTQYYCQAGNTYIIRSKYYSSGTTSSFDVTVVVSMIIVSETYTYYDDGVTVKTYLYTYDNGVGYSYSRFYAYDENGNCIAEEYSRSDGFSYSYTYAYDENGNCIAKEFSNSNGNSSYTTYTYDENGNCISSTRIDGDGDIVISIIDSETDTYIYPKDDGTASVTVYVSGYFITHYICTHSYELTHTLGDKNIYTCTTCGYFYTEAASVAEHTYTTVVTAPTCTSKGYTTYTCTDCEDSYVSDYVAATGHTYTSKVTTEATSTSAGVMTYTCTVCGYSYTETIAATGNYTNPFTDVSNSSAWYYNSVLWAVENSITSGTSATTFSPTKTCTRAEIVTFLWNLAGKPEPTTTENPFTDVSSSSWYYKAVMWAVENNITAGTTATTFSPTKTCTRCEAVQFLYNYAGKPSASSSSTFTDVSSSAWYAKSVNWAVANGITSGTGNNQFSPTKTCTRAEIVTFLYNFAG